MEHSLDDRPANVAILLFLAKDDGKFPFGLQADVAAQNAPILDVEKVSMRIEKVIHPL